MTRSAARIRTLTAFLLLLLGQLGVVMPAQAAACRRAPLRGELLVRAAAAQAARADQTGHDRSAPVDAPAPLAVGCAAVAAAIAEPVEALALPPATRVPVANRTDTPPGRLFTDPCFRPPRAS